MPNPPRSPKGDWIRCPHCDQKYDPLYLDQVVYHATVPHRPIPATGIIGEEVEPKVPEDGR